MNVLLFFHHGRSLATRSFDDTRELIKPECDLILPGDPSDPPYRSSLPLRTCACAVLSFTAAGHRCTKNDLSDPKLLSPSLCVLYRSSVPLHRCNSGKRQEDVTHSIPVPGAHPKGKEQSETVPDRTRGRAKGARRLRQRSPTAGGREQNIRRCSRRAQKEYKPKTRLLGWHGQRTGQTVSRERRTGPGTRLISVTRVRRSRSGDGS